MLVFSPFPSPSRCMGRWRLPPPCSWLGPRDKAMAKLLVTQSFQCCYKTFQSWSFSVTSTQEAVCSQKRSRRLMVPLWDWITRSHCLGDSCPGESPSPVVDVALTRNKPLFYCHWDSGGCLELQYNLAYTDYLWEFYTSARGWPESGGQKGSDKWYVRCICSQHTSWAHLQREKCIGTAAEKPWLADQSLSIFVNKASLERSHAHPPMHCLRLPWSYKRRAE